MRQQQQQQRPRQQAENSTQLAGQQLQAICSDCCWPASGWKSPCLLPRALLLLLLPHQASLLLWATAAPASSRSRFLLCLPLLTHPLLPLAGCQS